MAIDSPADIPIRRRADGRGWTFRYRAADGTRPRVTRPTLHEALAAWLEVEFDYVVEPLADATGEPQADGPTLRAFFDDVYCVKHLPDLSEDCAAQYQRYFDEHVDPVLGDDPIDRIGTKRVSDLIAVLRVKPRTRRGKATSGTLGIETIHKTLTMLHGVWRSRRS
jgi:hypothetical protein